MGILNNKKGLKEEVVYIYSDQEGHLSSCLLRIPSGRLVTFSLRLSHLRSPSCPPTISPSQSSLLLRKSRSTSCIYSPCHKPLPSTNFMYHKNSRAWLVHSCISYFLVGDTISMSIYPWFLLPESSWFPHPFLFKVGFILFLFLRYCTS